MKKTIIALLLFATVAGAAYLVYSRQSAAGKKGYVTKPVKAGDITSSISATGKLSPKVSVLVGTEVSGTIREVYVDYNSKVRKGQALVKLDQELFKTQAEQSEANLKNAQARLRELESGREMQRSGVKTSLDQKKAALDKATADYEREKALFGKGMVSKSDLDGMEELYLVARSQYEQATADSGRFGVIEAQIEQARASVKQAAASLATARTNLGKTVIKAPMDGVVIDKNVEVGQTVAASFSTPNLLQVGDLGLMEVEASIDEADVGQAAVGQKADFTVDAFPERVFHGVLSKIYYAPVTVQNVVTYTGVIDVGNPEGLLRPGMTANVKIITSEKNGVLLVPAAALRVKLDIPLDKPKGGRKGGRTVWVLNDKKPVPAEVRLGVTDFTNTEVLSGLKEGDQVIVETPDDGKAKARGNAPSGGAMRMVR